MIKSLIAPFSRGNGNLQIFLDFVLPDKIIQAAWAQTGIQYCIFIAGFP